MPAASAQVRVRADDRVLVVEIADGGAGGADPVRGTGLRGLADRVGALGGGLRIDSGPEGGTRIVAELPCE
jgi:signal transduction histidine kinase